jgi:hypothetical protein
MRRTLNKTYNHGITVLREASESPTMLAREFNRVYHRRFNMRQYNTAGTDVLTQDWDNLIILDACRLDLFKEYNTIDGDLSTRQSRGSNTVEFLRGNVASRDLWDTVYITANPQLNNHQDALNPSFYAVHNIWAGDNWDDDQRTVLPETLASEARKIIPKYPDKQLIIHFVQPHMPFIDSDIRFSKEMFDTDEDPWNWILKGEVEIDREEIWEAFAHNLELALPHVEALIDDLSGKTVVTSDHGQCIGDRSAPIPHREWGHPWGIYIDPLVTVPWLECAFEERRTIAADPPEQEDSEVADAVVEERLEDLGYVG